MIEVGDLVRYKGNQINTSRDGVWLVVSIEEERGWRWFRRFITLIKGSERRQEREHVLMKISSSRQQEKVCSKQETL
jgi:hypothetical protein